MVNRTFIGKFITYSVYVACAVMTAREAGVAVAEAMRDHGPGDFPVQQSFIPLAPGAVEPAGWLRDLALAARDGITGHLDENHPTVIPGLAAFCGHWLSTTAG
jgi:hypothetical protein